MFGDIAFFPILADLIDVKSGDRKGSRFGMYRGYLRGSKELFRDNVEDGEFLAKEHLLATRLVERAPIFGALVHNAPLNAL